MVRNDAGGNTDCGGDIGRWGDVRVGILDVAKKKPAAKPIAIARAR